MKKSVQALKATDLTVFFHGAGGHEALDRDLIGAVVLHELEEEGDGHRRAGHGEKVKFPVDNVQAAGCCGKRHNFPRAPLDSIHERERHPDGAADEDHKLNGIGPDDGGESAERGVDRGEQSHHANAIPRAGCR